MKWNYNEPKDGDVRIIKKFLFFPKYIDGCARWLCQVKIQQMYEFNYAWTGWKNICFID